jgi:hypothetical protein
MTTYKTITGREIKVSANRSKRTFTIVTESARYRTYPMNKSEFEANLNNAGNDWQQFLNTGDYYKL